MAVNDRKDLRQRIGGVGFCGDMITSTASAIGGAAGASLIDTKLQQQNSYWNGAQIAITSGASLGDYRWVTNWVQSTGTFTPDRVFTAQIAAAVTYEIHKVFSGEDINAAINQAILESKFRWAKPVVDQTIVMVANQYTYNLSGLTAPIDSTLGIDEIYYDTGAAGTGYPWALLEDDFWELRWSGDTPTLQLNQYPPYPTKYFRLIYNVRPAVLTSDSSVLSPNDEALAMYVCTRSAAILFGQRAILEREESAKAHWALKEQEFSGRANGFITQDRPAPQPGKVRYGTWGTAGGERGYYPPGRIHIG